MLRTFALLLIFVTMGFEKAISWNGFKQKYWYDYLSLVLWCVAISGFIISYGFASLWPGVTISAVGYFVTFYVVLRDMDGVDND